MEVINFIDIFCRRLRVLEIVKEKFQKLQANAVSVACRHCTVDYVCFPRWLKEL